MTYTVIIAEDDPLQARLLEQFCTKEGLQVFGAVSSGRRLIEEVTAGRPDLVIADITLKRQDGISAIREMIGDGLAPVVILVSGSVDPEHLLAGYDIAAVDYVRKPILRARFKQAVDRAKARVDARRRAAALPDQVNFITCKVRYRDLQFAEPQLLYAERTMLRKTKVVLSDGTHFLTSTPLHDIQAQCSERIVFSHRSYLVNTARIAAIETVPGGSRRNYEITLIGCPVKVPLTPTYYGECRQQMESFTGGPL
ncbi:DNA-binding LytR/AlgR family response regulator [Paenibacillus mucilaginosus]|uniref:LytR/AlgR family response regulator transcription factor n=1 Tax=Paenibacillus mucilaginosus TaxID=61624 RepID=UPI003D1BE617